MQEPTVDSAVGRAATREAADRAAADRAATRAADVRVLLQAAERQAELLRAQLAEVVNPADDAREAATLLFPGDLNNNRNAAGEVQMGHQDAVVEPLYAALGTVRQPAHVPFRQMLVNVSTHDTHHLATQISVDDAVLQRLRQLVDSARNVTTASLAGFVPPEDLRAEMEQMRSVEKGKITPAIKATFQLLKDSKLLNRRLIFMTITRRTEDCWKRLLRQQL